MCPIAEANAVASSIPGILEWIENFPFSGQMGRIHVLGNCLYIDELTHSANPEMILSCPLCHLHREILLP